MKKAKYICDRCGKEMSLHDCSVDNALMLGERTIPSEGIHISYSDYKTPKFSSYDLCEECATSFFGWLQEEKESIHMLQNTAEDEIEHKKTPPQVRKHPRGR